MKNMLKKIIKIFPLMIIFVFVFGITFIFVNNKISLNSGIKDTNALGVEGNVINTTAGDNTINTGIETTNKSPQNDKSETTTDPYYYGVGAKGLTSLQVSLLTKDFKESTTPFITTVSPVDQVWYFAYPDSYPPLKSIKDQNGFELISDFTVTTGNNIINLSGHKTTYRIYEYNNVTTLVSYKVIYIQS